MTRRSIASRVYVMDTDLGLVEVTHGSNHYDDPSPGAGMQIIRDIEPYRAAGSDVASDNKRPMIGSRSRHRAFLRDNGYAEVGNETMGSSGSDWVAQRHDRDERIYDIRRAMGDFGRPG